MSVGGNLIARLHLAEATLVSTVKRMIESAAGIPSSEQRLLIGSQVLSEGTCLSAAGCRSGQPVMMTMVRQRSRWALSGDSGGTICLWDIEVGLCLQQFASVDAAPIRAIAPDWAASVALCASNHTMTLWDLTRGSCLREIRAESKIRCLTMDWPSRRALAGSSDRSLRLYDLSTGKCVRTLLGHTSPVTCLDAAWVDMKALSGSDDGTVRLWDLETGECLWCIRAHTTVRDVSLDWRARLGVSAGVGPHGGEQEPMSKPSIDKATSSSSTAVRCWRLGAKTGNAEGDAPDSALVRQLPGRGGRGQLRLDADLSARVAVSAVCGESKVYLWDLEGGAMLRELKTDLSIQCVALAWTPRLALAGGVEGVLELLDISSGASVQELCGAHEGSITCVVAS